MTPDPVQSRLAVPDAALLALLGSRDESLRTAEDLLDADVHVRGNELTLTGDPADVAFAERVFTELITLAERGQQVSADAVRRTVEMLGSGAGREGESPAEVLSLDILSRRGRTIRPKTLNQKRYVDAIDAHTIVFGIGPAGTGKTYLAMAKAVQALQAKHGQPDHPHPARPSRRGSGSASCPARSSRRSTRTCARSTTRCTT